VIPPAVVIRLPIEGRPIVYADALNDAEAQRLADWLNASPDARELLELADRLARKAA
jgi:hypothetical protein